MQITRLTIKNFRNLADVDVELIPGTVVVGENRAGKSNLIHALRLVLDTSMSFADLQLSRDDFWDGLSDGSPDWNPMVAGCIIEVSIEVNKFDTDPRLIAALADALLPSEPLQARLTYRFGPVDTGGEVLLPGAVPQYRGQVWGGPEGNENPIPSRIRSYIYLHSLGALRDVESDIRNWQRSPLRRLLEAASESLDEEALREVKESLNQANRGLNELAPITDLGRAITERLAEMVGSAQSIDTKLAVTPDDPERIIRNMRLYVEGDANRPLSSVSLGTLNVLYLALLELGLDGRLAAKDIAHVMVAIEEPEAHLHPHLQRLIFRRLLTKAGDDQTVMVTTQSPHIASAVDPRSLVLLRNHGADSSASAAHTASLNNDEWSDIARYLDATRAELVFARSVLLVEGFGEEVLLPTMATQLGMDLDKLGITVCAIHGTHFKSYIAFCQAVGIPWAVVTDGDPDAKTPGMARAYQLVTDLGLQGTPEENGIFVGTTTFEYDVVAVRDNHTTCCDVLIALCAKPSQTTIKSWSIASPGRYSFMRIVENAGGKGRYAQRLAHHAMIPPPYIERALNHLQQK
ncbi:AAA family ATPase [Mycobacteroides franklinii]|uniref:AAA family ATPase n=1 Tax=Mycobacteroides franklinii TaxID=948102 RepID=UPI0013E8F338|nr:hypothetical protein [Mycobacteroides franklinii]